MSVDSKSFAKSFVIHSSVNASSDGVDGAAGAVAASSSAVSRRDVVVRSLQWALDDVDGFGSNDDDG